MLQSLRESLRQIRAKYPTVKLRASYRKKLIWKFPKAVEDGLRRALRKEIAPIITAVDSAFLQFHNSTRIESIRLDEAEDILYTRIRALEQTATQENEGSNLFGVLALIFAINHIDALTDRVKEELVRILNYYIPGEIPLDVGEYTIIASQFSNSLQQKVRYAVNRYFTKLYGLIDKYKKGEITLETLMSQETQVNTSFYKVATALIARDLIGSYLSKLQGALFNSVGIRYYKWQTAQDEKVRGDPTGLYPKAVPSHFDMQGVLCDNTNEFVYSDDLGKTWKQRNDRMPKAHPGEEPNCRCVRVPYLDGILMSIDKELNNGSNSI